MMAGFATNMLLDLTSERLTVQLILASPAVPCIALLIAAKKCPESPRYFMKPGPKRSAKKAFESLLDLRATEVNYLGLRQTD